MSTGECYGKPSAPTTGSRCAPRATRSSPPSRALRRPSRPLPRRRTPSPPAHSRIRVGLHTGEPLPVEHEDGYVGVDVHRAARICAAGHGGQVLFSQATRDLLDVGLEVLELGEHRLKDLAEPVSLYQLGRKRFPPLRTLRRRSGSQHPRPRS